MAIILLLSACSPSIPQSPSTPGMDTADSALSLTEWTMEGYDLARSRFSSDSLNIPADSRIEYQLDANTRFGSPISVAGGLLFAEAGRQLRAIEIATGVERWNYNVIGAFLSPAIVGETVFLRSESGNEGFVLALAADSGAKLWEFKVPYVGSPYGNFGGHVTSPVVADDLVLVGAGRSLFALHTDTGRLVWEFPLAEPVASSAAVGEDTVFISDFDRLYAIDAATGVERWGYDLDAVSLYFAPIVSEDLVLIANGNTIHALQTRDGQERWHYATREESIMPAAAASERVFAKSVNSLYALDRADGSPLWQFTATDFVSLPTVTAEHIFVITRQGGAGTLRGLRHSDGTELWHQQDDRLASAAPVIAGGNLFVRTEDGRIVAYR